MADKQVSTDAYTDENLGYVYENRRYVGKKETAGFVLWDAAQSLNINTYSSRFITNIVKIDLGYQTIAKSINSIWDIVNWNDIRVNGSYRSGITIICLQTDIC